MHQLVWSIHHVVIDGWCLSVLLHEFLDIDESIRRGREPALKPTRPFRDYVAWLRDRDDAEAEGYWRQALRGVTAATPLGLERSLVRSWPYIARGDRRACDRAAGGCRRPCSRRWGGRAGSRSAR